MKLPPEGARWLVSLRWLACAAVLAVTWLTSSELGIVADPRPLYLIAAAMAGYNLLFCLSQCRPWAGEGNVERIFEPFFTTRADSGGTGLGLGLCRRLISEMGGRIRSAAPWARGPPSPWC